MNGIEFVWCYFAMLVGMSCFGFLLLFVASRIKVGDKDTAPKDRNASLVYKTETKP